MAQADLGIVIMIKLSVYGVSETEMIILDLWLIEACSRMESYVHSRSPHVEGLARSTSGFDKAW